MDDKDSLSNKSFRVGSTKRDKKDLHSSIRQCYHLGGKYFIIIDDLIMQKLNLIDSEKSDLFFQQHVSEDGSIILRRFDIRGGT